MFMGEYSHSIDAKGRLIIPSKFREGLGEEFVVTKGLDGCLSIYPMEEWKIFEKKLEALPLTGRGEFSYRQRCGNLQAWRKMWYLPEISTGLRSGARRNGVRTTTTMIWMRLQRICRRWELSSSPAKRRIYGI